MKTRPIGERFQDGDVTNTNAINTNQKRQTSLAFVEMQKEQQWQMESK